MSDDKPDYAAHKCCVCLVLTSSVCERRLLSDGTIIETWYCRDHNPIGQQAAIIAERDVCAAIAYLMRQRAGDVALAIIDRERQ